MGYSWVPAHALPSCNDTWLFITYEKNKVKLPTPSGEGETSQGGFKRSIIRCPDRTLTIISKPEYRPIDTVFDECIPLTLFDKNSVFDEIGIGLISSELGNSANLNIEIPKSHTLIADSGGAQLKLGSKSFVDPFEVIDWMNRNSNLGCSLDICPRGQDFIDIDKMDPVMKAASSLQKQNNKIFKSYKKKSLKLCNVLHGFNLAHHKEWAEKVDDSSFTSWAVGGEGNTIFNSYSGMIFLHQNFPRKHYHFFGQGATTKTIVNSWISKHIGKLTADSTTHRNGSMTREVQILSPYGLVKMYYCGNIRKIKQGVLNHIMCNCPVCSRVGYFDIYGFDSKYKTDRLIVWHNMLTLSRQAKYWSNLAEQCTDKEYIDNIIEAINQDGTNTGIKLSKVNKMREAIRYIEYAIKLGVDKANQHFKVYFKGGINSSNDISGNVSDFYLVKKKETYEKRDTSAMITSCFSSQPSLAVDVLPSYLSKDALDGYNIDPKNYNGYEDYQKKVKYIKDQTGVETYDRQFIRKYPWKCFKQMRKNKLKELE